MLASLSLETSDLKKIDYTNASVDRLLIHDHGRDYLKFSSVSFQELRRHIFSGISTPDLLSGAFSSITDNPPEGSSFRKQKTFVAGCVQKTINTTTVNVSRCSFEIAPQTIS